uniref:Uncharacterized protein n=1 Tax=Branchiostoma floridae TaxID=7739 RepID=C4A0M2_BRAFL|eukprot:XP_002585655.1 hypothetical protein BRAFLDRAFT_111622 [Branchiostoma floridae]
MPRVGITLVFLDRWLDSCLVLAEDDCDFVSTQDLHLSYVHCVRSYAEERDGSQELAGKSFQRFSKQIASAIQKRWRQPSVQRGQDHNGRRGWRGLKLRECPPRFLEESQLNEAVMAAAMRLRADGTLRSLIYDVLSRAGPYPSRVPLRHVFAIKNLEFTDPTLYKKYSCQMQLPDDTLSNLSCLLQREADGVVGFSNRHLELAVTELAFKLKEQSVF